MKESSDSELINKLILDGGIEVAAIDQETGEFLYSFTPKIKELMPNVYEEHIETVNSEVMNLWEKGFLNIDLFESDPIITITEKALNKKNVKTLSKREQWSLLEIIRLLKRKA
jgi:uncharacterized protein YjgD (DUF1641 family)